MNAAGDIFLDAPLVVLVRLFFRCRIRPSQVSKTIVPQQLTSAPIDPGEILCQEVPSLFPE